MIPANRESFAIANGRARLPYDAEVEWLGTTARGPFINTGIRATYNARVKMRFYIGDATATWQAPFGGDQNTYGGGTYFMNGSFSSLRIYNRVLTAT